MSAEGGAPGGARATGPAPEPAPGPRPEATPEPPPARVACVQLPHLAMAIETRADPPLAARPAAVVTAEAGVERVYDLSYVAHRAGLRRGMPVAQARRVCPELALLPARPDAYRETWQALLALLGRFAPAVEPADPERSWLATAGLARRGGPEQRLAEALAEAVQRELGLAVRVGLAHGKLTSRIITSYLSQQSVLVLPSGVEVAFLAGLSLRYLPLSARTLARLQALGLAKVQAFAALPAAGILPRFGYEGLRAYRLAQGHDDPQVRPWAEAPFLQAEHAFLEPVANLRTLADCLHRLAQRIAAPLAQDFRMAGALTLELVFEDGRRALRERVLAEPTPAAGLLFTHARALMDSLDWLAPVARLRLAAQGLAPNAARQLGLFRQAHEAQAEVEATLRRIQARYGADVVHQGERWDPRASLPERRAGLKTWGAA